MVNKCAREKENLGIYGLTEYIYIVVWTKAVIAVVVHLQSHLRSTQLPVLARSALRTYAVAAAAAVVVKVPSLPVGASSLLGTTGVATGYLLACTGKI